jgi:hypothetical protein
VNPTKTRRQGLPAGCLAAAVAPLRTGSQARPRVPQSAMPRDAQSFDSLCAATDAERRLWNHVLRPGGSPRPSMKGLNDGH